MKTTKYIVPLATLMFLMLTSISCNKKKLDNNIVIESADTTDFNLSYPPNDYETLNNLTTLVNSIINGDVKQLAQVCNFPIWRPYPEKTISNEKELAKMFDTIFDDSIRNSLKNMSAKDWEQVGWRGYMLNNGMYFWATEGGKLNYINYESAKLLGYRQKLMEQEKQNISESDVWQTHDCFISIDSTLFLRMESFDDVERLHIFLRDTSDRRNPYTFNGTVDIQGSGGNKYYTYLWRGEDNSVRILISSPRCSGEGEFDHAIWLPNAYDLPTALSDTFYILTPTYWRDVKKWW